MAEQLSLLEALFSPALTTLSGVQDLRSVDEIYDMLDASMIPILVETRKIEFKSGRVEPKVLGEYLSMWANTQPEGGIFVVGVENNKTITGLLRLGSEKKGELEYLSRFCSDAIWTSKEVPVLNEKGQQDLIIAYRVQYREDKVVETSAHEAFIREGTSKLKMSDTLRREIGIAKGEIRHELDTVNLTYPEDFNSIYISKFCVAFSVYKRLTDPKSEVEVLELARLGKRQQGRFLPNLACALLFAHDPSAVIPGSMIRILRYDGLIEEFGQDLNVIFDSSAEGPIPAMLEEARLKIGSQIRSYQRLNGSRLERRQEYPEPAWFEAVVNAVGHRSYNFKMQNVFVKMFNDRIVIESPGGFVPPTTAASVYESHNPRNRVLMDAMMHLDLTHCGYEGTRRMLREMTKANLPAPKFLQIQAGSHQVHVTLHNTPLAQAATRLDFVIDRMDRDDLVRLEREERQILKYLTEHKFITATVAMRITSRSWPTAKKYIASLIDKGMIEKSKGNDKDAPKASYTLTEE